MIRRISALLGIGLVVLWLVGLGSPYAARWLVWLDGVAALCAFGIAGMSPQVSNKPSRIGAAVILSLGLFALWIIGLISGAAGWLVWWTFAFGCAFMVTALLGAKPESMPKRPPQELPSEASLETRQEVRKTQADIEREKERERERERFRKGA